MARIQFYRPGTFQVASYPLLSRPFGLFYQLGLLVLLFALSQFAIYLWWLILWPQGPLSTLVDCLRIGAFLSFVPILMPAIGIRLDWRNKGGAA